MIRLAVLVPVPIAPIMHYALGSVADLGVPNRHPGCRRSNRLDPRCNGTSSPAHRPGRWRHADDQLGSLAELLLALFVVAHGQAEVVHAQITGSIIGTSLLGLGLAIVVGGFGRERQTFKRERAGLLSSLLILVVIALLLPAVFDFTARSVTHAGNVALSDEALSLMVSSVLLLLYFGNLVYTLVTHRDVFSTGEEHEAGAAWPLWQCLAVLTAATVGAALESKLISDALADAASALHLSSTFLGVIVLALEGTIADLFSAVWFARQDRMGLMMRICIGSTIQIALVVAPLLVILSWIIGSPMT